MYKCLLFCTLIIFTFTGADASGVSCKLKGTVVNRTSKAILLLKSPGDPRVESIRIPIVNNQFDYTLQTRYVEAFQLVFEDEYENGAYTPVLFFPDSKEILFTLYPQEIAYQKDMVKGGLLNDAYAAYKTEMSIRFDSQFDEVNKKINELRKQNRYNSSSYDSLMNLLSKTQELEVKRKIYLSSDSLHKIGADFTPKGKAVFEEEQAILQNRTDWRYDYLRKNPTLFSYYLLFRDTYFDARANETIAKNVRELYPFFASLFPEHPYTERMGNQIAGLNLRRPGQDFVDFTAPDLTNKTWQFSKLLNGKITLLDLWGSWCGPCIAATRTMRPVYEEFKNKGFQIVGVAREFKELSALKNALKREKYPWLNLVDLDDKNQIWSKYNISNSGGSIFLFDRQGKILAVNPTAEQVRKILLVELK